MRLSAALLVVALVVSPVAGTGADRIADDPTPTPSLVGAESAATGPPSTVAPPFNETAPNVTDADATTMAVALRESGDARWNVSLRFALRDRNETEAFRRLAERYRSGGADVGYSRRTFERVVELAGTDTERPMALRRVNRSARLLNDGRVGVVSLSFTWTNFTQVVDGELVLGDVFWVGSDTWLPTLNDDQTLVIAGPDNYYISGASPSGGTINGAVLEYEGPQRFEAGDFGVTYSPKVTETPTTTEGFPISEAMGLTLVVILFGGGFGVYALAQRRSARSEPAEEPGDGDGSRSPRATEHGEDAPDSDPDADDEDPEGADDGPDTELLSDEERVLRLLEANDGRMKQAQIVKETNWSNAKVSQLLSTMDENDEVDKLRIGRENLITLPDEDVTDVD